jgi:pimeloyl-ACP methyl ester carboxylesterase
LESYECGSAIEFLQQKDDKVLFIMKPVNIFRGIGVTIMLLFLLASMTISAPIIIIISNSSGKPKQFLDENKRIITNSISEKGFIEINGAKLYFFIKGKNLTNPILLYLHGGMPDYFLTQKYPTGLDDIFTVVWWEQRGAGLSYNARFKESDVTIDNLIDDTKDITNYLRNRFSRDKIYLMAHSGGSYLGIKVIEKYPELYTAYIGVAQISYQKLSEKKACDYILEHYRNDKKKEKIVNDLIQNPIIMTKPIPTKYTRIRDYAMHDLGIGTMHNMNSVVTGLFIPSLLFKEYSLREKIVLWKGKASSGISIIWNEMITHDLTKENIIFKIPVFFLHGIYDYTCSYELAKEYFEKISAPRKGFYSFNNSAHSPIFEEPKECIEIIKENILNKNKTF